MTLPTQVITSRKGGDLIMNKTISALLSRKVAVPFITGLLVVTGSSAFATVDPQAYDPTSLFTQITTWLTGVLIPVAVGLMVLGITVKIGFKMVKKFANRVG